MEIEVEELLVVFASSSPVVIVLPVPFVHAVREQKLPRVNWCCSHENAMRPGALPSNDRTPRPFKRSMPCDRASRVPMPKACVGVICVGLAMWGGWRGDERRKIDPGHLLATLPRSGTSDHCVYQQMISLAEQPLLVCSHLRSEVHIVTGRPIKRRNAELTGRYTGCST